VATLAVRHMPEKMRGSYHWRGANWVEMSWLAIQGLSRCGHDAEAARVAEANCRMVFDTLANTGHFREFYNSRTGAPSDLTDYVWTSMPAIMIVETFFGIRPTADGIDIRPTLPEGWNEIGIRNLHVRGRIMSLTVRREGDLLAIELNGRRLAPADASGVKIPWRE
jgi:glycogen debranching enzyme